MADAAARGAVLADVVLDGDALVVLAVLAGVVLVALLLLWRRRRRALVRRLATLSLRLEERPPSTEPRGLERTVVRLERAADRSVLRVRDAEVAASQLAGTLDVLPQGVVICDDQGEIVYRNEPASRFTSARHGEALVAATISDLLQLAVDGRAERRTLDLFGPPRRTLVIAVFPLDDATSTVGGLAIIDDVSERRRLEAVRRDFVANISHELKTPVGGLGLLAETLLDEEDPAVVQRLAQRMQYEALRVGRTIDDLLELTRIEAEETRAREPVPVHLVIAEAVERIRAAADRAHIDIRVDEAPPGLTLLGDRRQLTSALSNLLENAVKYSDEGSDVEVNLRTGSGEVAIDVRDHGIGIPTRDVERIFERFYRVDRARSRETGGTGLGLSIVRHVANNHNGNVTVASREGEGSTFTLTLPAGPGPAAIDAETAEAG
jgi:two-component system sensor histidine kinase SenX3